HLEPTAATAVAEAAAQRILEPTTKDSGNVDEYHLLGLLKALTALTERLPPPRASASARTAWQHLQLSSGEQLWARNLQDISPGARSYQQSFREAATRLAARLAPDDAADAAHWTLDSPARIRIQGAAPPLSRLERVEILLPRCTSQGL